MTTLRKIHRKPTSRIRGQWWIRGDHNYKGIEEKETTKNSDNSILKDSSEQRVTKVNKIRRGRKQKKTQRY